MWPFRTPERERADDPDPGHRTVPGSGSPSSPAPAAPERRGNDRGARVVAPLMAGLFSLALVPAWIDALSHVPAAQQVLAAVLGTAYTVACVLALPLAQRMPVPGQGVYCMVLVAAGLVFVGLTGLTNSWVLLCGLGIVASLLPIVVTAVVTVVTTLGLSLTALQLGTFSEQFPNLVVLVSVTLATAAMVRLFEANAALTAARDEVAALAVARERQRLARDLHDILGHSLTTITLKAGLARRSLETGGAERAATEIGDVERLGRQALRDVRATVSEFRETTLPAELAGVGETLRAAGIEADLPRAVDDVEPRLQQVFAYVLREAVTNVVRHSGAARVSVRLGRNWITVADDGLGMDGVEEGNGLTGLRERLAAVGGTATARTGPSGGCEVRAEAPGEPPTATDTASAAGTAARPEGGT